MLSKLKILTNSSDETLLELLIVQCEDFATDFCNLDEYDDALDNIVCQMCVERFNKINSEGLNSKSYSSLSESYTDDFSSSIYRQLKKHRKLRTVSTD